MTSSFYSQSGESAAEGAYECVLAQLSLGDRYGYELTDRISTEMEIAGGTLYPILKKLKEDDYVTTYLVESENGPARKYYHLSDEGRKYQESLKEEWIGFVKAVEAIINGGKNE